jgi:hypothetical protein
MILIAAALACVASVPLTGGRLGRLIDLRLRWAGAALSALALQVVITTLAPAGSTSLHELLHVASYALAAACILANRRIIGLPILALGAALNGLAIAANHGIMPASVRAMHLAGLAPAAHFANSAPLAHPHLLALGDVIPVPGPWPLGNVMSIGDILVIAGLLAVLHHACRPPRTHQPKSSADTDATQPTPASYQVDRPPYTPVHSDAAMRVRRHPAADRPPRPDHA